MTDLAKRWPALKGRLDDTLRGFTMCLESCAAEVIDGPQSSTTSRGTPFATFGFGGIVHEGHAPFFIAIGDDEYVLMRNVVDMLEVLHRQLQKDLLTRPRLVWRKRPEVYVRDAHTEEEIVAFGPGLIMHVPHIWVRMRLATEPLEC